MNKNVPLVDTLRVLSIWWVQYWDDERRESNLHEMKMFGTEMSEQLIKMLGPWYRWYGTKNRL